MRDFLGFLVICVLAVLPAGAQCGRCGAGGNFGSPASYRIDLARTTPVPGFPLSTNGADSAALTVRWHAGPEGYLTGPYLALPAYTLVDLVLEYSFAAPVTITGLELDSGAPGVITSTVLDAGIRPSSPLRVPAGKGMLAFQVSTSAANYMAGAYALLRTTDAPTGRVIGIARGQIGKGLAVDVFDGDVGTALPASTVAFSIAR